MHHHSQYVSKITTILKVKTKHGRAIPLNSSLCNRKCSSAVQQRAAGVPALGRLTHKCEASLRDIMRPASRKENTKPTKQTKIPLLAKGHWFQDTPKMSKSQPVGKGTLPPSVTT